MYFLEAALHDTSINQARLSPVSHVGRASASSVPR